MRHSSHLHLHFHTHHRAARYDVDMTKGSITKHLINFALPLMVGNLFQQLYNMVDTWVVGNYVSNEAFSAVGTVTPIINTLIGFFLGLSSGAGVVISQYYGAGREDKVRQAVHTSLVLTLLMGAVFTAAGIAMTPLMLRLMKTPAEVAPEQTTYLTIYFAGVMGLLLYNMGSGILRAVGDSRRPFYFLVVSAVLNTALDLLFVLRFGMGVEGVAYATIIAQAVSAALTIWVLMRAAGCIRVELRALRMTWSVLRQIVSVGIPAALQMAITAFSNVFVQGYINYFGPDCMSGWTAYTKVDQLVILPVQSIAMAGTTFVGQNYGAGRMDRVRKGAGACMMIGVVLTASVGVLLYNGGYLLVELFTTDQQVQAISMDLLHFMVPTFITYIAIEILSGTLRGVGDAWMPLIITGIGVCAVRVLWIMFVLPHYHTIIGAAFCYPLTWSLTTVAFVIYYYFFSSLRRWKLKPLKKRFGVYKPF